MGMIGVWEGVPTGFALRLHPLLTAIITVIGAIFATLIVFFLGERLRDRLARRRPPKNDEPPKERLIDRVWRRYGVIGLGLLGPGLTGAPIAVAIGLSLRASARQLLFWLFLGITLWTAAITVVGMAGTAGVMHLLKR